MAGIFGSLSISDSDRVFQATIGQRVIYDTAVAWVNERNAELDAAMALFVEETTQEHSRRYKLPGGGYLQRRNSSGRFADVKASGQWDVAFPLEDFGAALGWNDVDRGYMTVAELDRHISTIVTQNVNTVRFEMLRAIFKSTDTSFIDPLWGTLTVKHLANGTAGELYPPVLGGTTDATENHYLESNYLATAISDTNNPYLTISTELEEHFGTPTGGSNIAVFIHPDEVPETRLLTDFVPVSDMGIRYGIASDLANAVPAELARVGRVIGRMDGAGVWVAEWRYLPTGYMVGIHLDAPKPLVRRIDPADTGLGDGLQLVAEDTEYPLSKSSWRHRFGFGAGNRLNGVVMELAAGGSYTTPTIYQ